MTQRNLETELAAALDVPPTLSGNAWTSRYTLVKDFLGFQGHFPLYPVLPAFVQVSMVRHTLAAAMKKKLSVSRLENAKFLAPVKPGETVHVCCHPCIDRSGESGWECLLAHTWGKTSDQAAEAAATAAKFRLFFDVH